MPSYASSLMKRAGAHLLTKVSAERDDSGAMLEATIKPLNGDEIKTTYILAPMSVEERLNQFGDRETKTTRAEKVVHLTMVDRLARIAKNWGVTLAGEPWAVDEVQSVNASWAVVTLQRVTDRTNRNPRA